jgi:DNA gyrase subunit B
MSEPDPSPIVVLRGLEPIRKRPGMYVGDPRDRSSLHNLLWVAVDHVLDLHLDRCATELHVDIAPDAWVTVRDDGPGTLIEDSCTRLHGGAYHPFPRVPFGDVRIGLGFAVINALSTRLEVETTRDGTRWAQAFARGEIASDLRCLGPTAIVGTTMRFRPDPEIFGAIELDLATVESRLQELAWLNPLLRISFQDRRRFGAGGPAGWVCSRGGVVGFGFVGAVDDIAVDLAIGWRPAGGAPEVHGFVNMRAVADGTHVDGIWHGLADAAAGLTAADNVRELLAPGLLVMLHVGMEGAQLGSVTHPRLQNPKAEAVVRHVIVHRGDRYAFQRHLKARLAAR